MSAAEVVLRPSPRRRGTWRAVGAGWPGFVPAVLGNAAVQGLLVVGDPSITDGAGLIVRVAASAVAVIIAVVVVAATASAAVTGRPARPREVARVAVATVVLGAVAAVGAVVSPWAGPVLLLLGAPVLSSVASGRPLGAGFAAAGRSPVRAGLAVLAYAIVAVISWVAALLLGLFVGGPVGAGLTWLWFGLVAVVVLCAWTVPTRSQPG